MLGRAFRGGRGYSLWGGPPQQLPLLSHKPTWDPGDPVREPASEIFRHRVARSANAPEASEDVNPGFHRLVLIFVGAMYTYITYIYLCIYYVYIHKGGFKEGVILAGAGDIIPETTAAACAAAAWFFAEGLT